MRKYSDKNRALINHRRETIRITPSVPNKRDIANIIQHKIYDFPRFADHQIPKLLFKPYQSRLYDPNFGICLQHIRSR